MRYVVVCVIKGKAGEFNNHLRKEVWEKLGAKSSKLPAHFTIKAPFEYDETLKELENVLEEFTKKENAQPFRIDGYGHFDNRVVYMDVNMSKQAKELHDRLIDAMGEVPYIDFDRKDGKDKTFHITVASKRIQPIYKKLWEYVKDYPCQFGCYFDNISIYKWETYTWKLYREFKLEK